MTEFCNDPAGYQVWLDHPQLSGAVYVDGERITLSQTGSTLISHSTTAANRTRKVVLEPAGEGPHAISIRIVPL